MINNQLLEDINQYVEDNLIENEDLFVREYSLKSCICANNGVSFEKEPIIPEEETFSEKLLKIIDSRNLTDSDVYNKANIDRRLFSKIRSNKDYNPSKRTVLAFCIALNLDIDETENLLEKAGYALSYSKRSDLIVRYFIENIQDYTLFDVDEALMAFNQNPISKY